MTMKTPTPAPPRPIDLEAAYEEHGPEAIRTLRRYDPGAYVAAIARLVADEDD